MSCGLGVQIVVVDVLESHIPPSVCVAEPAVGDSRRAGYRADNMGYLAPPDVGISDGLERGRAA